MEIDSCNRWDYRDGSQTPETVTRILPLHLRELTYLEDLISCLGSDVSTKDWITPLSVLFSRDYHSITKIIRQTATMYTTGNKEQYDANEMVKIRR